MRHDLVNTAQLSARAFRVRGHLHSRFHVPALTNAEVLPMRPYLSDQEEEALIAANRSRFDDTQIEAVRLLPPSRIPVGGGWTRTALRWLRELGPLLAVLGTLVLIGVLQSMRGAW